ncbi:MAG TPA: hypothetical protein VKS01_06630 [Bryobacteraceae bacterium]|nr:hypothetical protein [Bryobacteraceae bacterium]
MSRIIFSFIAIIFTARGAITVATVGDSLADAVYLGMKLQPDLLKKSDIKLMRWSRAKIGLTRTDYFDYTAWIRDAEDLGSADFCVVEMGANDLQSINIGKNKWVMVGSERWQQMYRERVKAFVNTLRDPQKGMARCKSVIWLLQPAYEKNKFLSQYHGMINAMQFAGSNAGVAAAFELMTTANDYQADGVHFNKPFCFALSKAVIHLFAPMKGAASNGCTTCHTQGAFPLTAQSAPLALRRAE